MKKFKKIAFLSLVALLTACGSSGSESVISSISSEDPSITSSVEDVNMIKLLNDTSFENGFELLTTSTLNGRNLSGILNYNGEAKGAPYWQMSQWWTPFDFIDNTFTKLGDGHYKYENKSRSVEIDSPNNSITLNLNSWTEYKELYGQSRTGSEQWSHLLLEQSFKDPQKLADLAHIYVKLKFKLNKSQNMDEGQPIPCAQITWYFTITDVKNGDPTYESGDNDFFWFGLPFYDSRYQTITGYKHVDSGFVGATNKLIYCIDSCEILKSEPIVIGEEQEIDLDILPLIKQAYSYGLQNDASFSNSEWRDLWINYMNLGWELPGSYDVSITIRDLSVNAVLKEGKK